MFINCLVNIKSIAMKKEILEALTTKFPGESASILGRIADKLAKTATTAEQVKTAVEGVGKYKVA